MGRALCIGGSVLPGVGHVACYQCGKRCGKQRGVLSYDKNELAVAFKDISRKGYTDCIGGSPVDCSITVCGVACKDALWEQLDVTWSMALFISSA